MNEETWERLREHGVNESTQLRLDFSYAATDRASAESLRAVLADQTVYDVKVQSTGTFTKRWMVEGSAQSTAVSSAILDRWVDWMVTAGLQQHCEFDGWGAEVPSRCVT